MASDVQARVATQIRVEMARRQLRGPDLAAILGISKQSVSRKLNSVDGISLEDLDAISRAWDIPMSVLLGEPATVSAA